MNDAGLVGRREGSAYRIASFNGKALAGGQLRQALAQYVLHHDEVHTAGRTNPSRSRRRPDRAFLPTCMCKVLVIYLESGLQRNSCSSFLIPGRGPERHPQGEFRRCSARRLGGHEHPGTRRSSGCRRQARCSGWRRWSLSPTGLEGHRLLPVRASRKPGSMARCRRA